MSANLISGSIPKHIFNLAGPMSIGIFAMMFFNLADTFFVGQLGTKELSAISYTFPVVTIIISLSVGLSVSLSSLVSREIGAGNDHKVKEITTDALSLALLLVSLLTLGGILTIEPTFRLLGASPEMIVLIRQYMEIWILNMIFVIIPMVGNGAIRGSGDTKFPALIMVVAGGINLILDPILIFGLWGFPRMELRGAALSTVISRALTLFGSLYVLHYRKNFLTTPFRPFHLVWNNWCQIIKLTIPLSLSNSIVPISMAIGTRMVASFGDLAVAGFGVGSRIEGFFSIVLMGVSAGLGPYVGQNWGARKFARVRQGLKISNLIQWLWVAILSGLVFLAGQWLVAQFNTNLEVQSVAFSYLKIIILTLGFLGVMLNISSAVTATGQPKLSLLLTFSRTFLIFIPLAIWLKHVFQVEGIFMALAFSNTLVGIMAIILGRRVFQKCYELK